VTEEKRYYVLKDLAEANGVSARAVADAARAGKITTYKPAGTRLVTMEDFEAYMSNFRSGPVPPPKEARVEATEKFARAQAAKRARSSRKGDAR
jgi:hypothetical protein